MPSFAAQQSLFRAYDIRGSRQHFTNDFIHALGHAFAHLYQLQQKTNNENNSQSANEKTIVVIGYDVRCDSDTIAQALAHILSQQGIQVIQLGLVTTPMMIFWAEQYQGHGIIITASHSAKDILGVKWLVNHISPSSADIQVLYRQLTSYDTQNPFLDSIAKPVYHKQQHLPAKQVASAYIDAITKVFKQIYQHNNQPLNQTAEDSHLLFSKLDLVVVIDCMHGATSNIAKPLFTHFCQQVIALNDTPDGDFPAGNPDPTEPQRLKQLQQSVLLHQADIGIAFDGDGDRLMVVDNQGKVVTPDHLLYLLATVAVNQRPQPLKKSLSNAQVLFDIKCCHHLPKLIAELGATPVISKTGSSLMRQQMQQSDGQIIFAGELSGHFIFNDSYFILYDDAMYAALRLLHWLAKPMPTKPNCAINLAGIIDALPIIVSTADHYLPLTETALTDCSIVQQLARFCQYLQQLVHATSAAFITQPDQQAIISCAPSICTCSAKNQYTTLEQAQKLLPVGTKLSCIDGVRLDFARGFGVLRQSNTSQNLTVRFAGDSIADLTDIQTRFAALCRPFNEHLATQILAIVAE
ncbi:phosphomannomutase/phosphoglucomutase [Psychrobacter maritimus]|uniref:phosphomannomutase/phosphoglucomutase n=1 Tax=Psychrobacter maritimus TaxID=256325 RepID=UPI00248BB996|nr:phosphomannomutase/phosphoglucomutase [Psychrobacter sp. WB2]WGV12309.1 phosphomannomutase/phosphoglucomutase [Psychrobacter sp. WB2]